ncbi:MAG: hypothetical protein K7J46_20010 [Bryobacter sp.]|jgi:hypothetical protein|nr:hypothetical protein [Bryobacter sp. CoA8 C33]
MLILTALEVLRLIVGAEEAMNKVREQYTHRENVAYNNGRTEEYEVVRVNGKAFRRLVARQGKPLPDKERAVVLRAMRRFARGLTVPTRIYTMRFGEIRKLESTHDLSIEDNKLLARPREGNPYLHRLHFDPDTHRLHIHAVEVTGPGSELSPGTVARLYYNSEGFLEKLIIDFQIGKRRGRQMHIHSGYRKFDAASTITFEDIP